MSNSTYLDLLTENAQLHQKIGLLEKSSEAQNPWAQKEIQIREAKIEDLTKALEDRMSEVQLIEEKSQLQTVNESLGEKLQRQQEELRQTQSQLKDARDQADLLEFRVLELEEENEKVNKRVQFFSGSRAIPKRKIGLYFRTQLPITIFFSSNH